MWPVGLDELARDADAFDDAVARTPGIDRFCSSSAWVLAAHAALMGEREPWILRGDRGWAATARVQRHAGAWFLEPLELAWGLACPLVGEPREVAPAFVAAIADRPGWDGLLVGGIPVGGDHERAMLAALPRGWRWGRGPTTERFVASLEGGVDGFLSRRSRNFRKALRADQRAAAAHGIRYEEVTATTATAATAALDRVLAIERRSWKGQSGVGVAEGPMRDFYAAMVPRLAERGRLRLVFARHADHDVAFVLGGVFAGEYRGLQFSFDDSYRRFSPGNLLQREQIERLAAEGVLAYDLGTAMDYKERWAESVFATAVLVVLRP